MYKTAKNARVHIWVNSQNRQFTDHYSYLPLKCSYSMSVNKYIIKLNCGIFILYAIKTWLVRTCRLAPYPTRALVNTVPAGLVP